MCAQSAQLKHAAARAPPHLALANFLRAADAHCQYTASRQGSAAPRVPVASTRARRTRNAPAEGDMRRPRWYQKRRRRRGRRAPGRACVSLIVHSVKADRSDIVADMLAAMAPARLDDCACLGRATSLCSSRCCCGRVPREPRLRKRSRCRQRALDSRARTRPSTARSDRRLIERGERSA